MQWLQKARHTFHYSNCYLYWCVAQIVIVLGLISLFFVDIYNGTSTKFLFDIELAIFLFMAADLVIYFILFGCTFQGVILVEMFITLGSGVILVLLMIDHFKEVIEEYDFALMISRIFVQVIRLALLGFKTTDNRKKNQLTEFNFELNDVESGVHTGNNRQTVSNMSVNSLEIVEDRHI